MTVSGPFSVEDREVYDEVLAFLQGVHGKAGEYREGRPDEETTRDVLLLNFVKVVNDCRAILLLTDHGFYIQGGIVIRSTVDAANLVMHIGVEGDDAHLAGKWVAGDRLTHWMLVENLNEHVGGQLHIDSYRGVRRRLDDFVHGNYRALRLYPAQASGATPLDESGRSRVTFWTALLDLCLVTCLLVVPLIEPSVEEQADGYVHQLVGHDDTR